MERHGGFRSSFCGGIIRVVILLVAACIAGPVVAFVNPVGVTTPDGKPFTVFVPDFAIPCPPNWRPDIDPAFDCNSGVQVWVLGDTTTSHNPPFASAFHCSGSPGTVCPGRTATINDEFFNIPSPTSAIVSIELYNSSG